MLGSITKRLGGLFIGSGDAAPAAAEAPKSSTAPSATPVRTGATAGATPSRTTGAPLNEKEQAEAEARLQQAREEYQRRRIAELSAADSGPAALATPGRPSLLAAATPARAAAPEEVKEVSLPAGTAAGPPINLEGVVVGAIKAEGLGTLYSVNAAGEAIRKAARVKAALVASEENDFEYYFQLYSLDAEKKAVVLMTQPVSSAMQMNFDKKTRSLVWIVVREGKVFCWRFDFFTEEEERNFKINFSIALMEVSRQEQFSKSVTAGDKEWVTAANDEMDTKEDEEPSEDEKDELDFDGYDSKRSSTGSSRSSGFGGRRSDGSESGNDDEPAPRSSVTISRVGDRSKSAGAALLSGGADAGDDDATNNALAVGMSLNRAFVLRGSKMGVFRHDEEDQMEFLGKIDSIKDRSGNVFQPSKAMLHEQDTKMLLLNPDKPESVFCMDLHRGEVVDEWKAGGEFKVRAVGPNAKYAQKTGERMVNAVSLNAVFGMDPRLSGAMAVNQQSYTKTPGFTSIVANGEGHVVAGDAKGELRLYSDTGKRAKTLLPGLGDGVIGVDVTEDGKHILATTKAYLLLIPTSVPDDKKGRTGFQVGLGKNKPTPIKLQLDPRHLAQHGITNVNFTAAHFNTGENINEQWIVTSTGTFIITWNMRRVLKGHRYDYKIRNCGNTVVADAFRFAMEDQVVVTTESDIFLERRKLVRKSLPASAHAAGKK